MVTFVATWISAFSTEKMEDGDAERDRTPLAVGGEFGETCIAGCRKKFDVVGELSGEGSSKTISSSGSKT